MNISYHDPVLLNEIKDIFGDIKNNKYIDCTIGDGGHSLELLKQGGIVLGIDTNELSLKRATSRFMDLGLSENFIPVLDNFVNLNKICEKFNFFGVSGILYDLGYSSYQLDQTDIGLSFLKDNPLDMRLNKSLGVTAMDLVNALPEKQLAQIIFNYSQEALARKFARAIVNSRSLKKIETTKQLADIIASQASLGYEKGRIHPATRTFQALRIVVNNEIENLSISLPQASHLLPPGGKIVVISFHSLEDKIVKQFVQGAGPNIKMITKKPIVPTTQEITRNPRSRSAKMRVLIKI